MEVRFERVEFLEIFGIDETEAALVNARKPSRRGKPEIILKKQ